MARIKNIELPKEKRTVIGLTYIYGIGRSLSETICAAAKVDPNKKIKDLTGTLISPQPDQEGNKLMFLSELREFPSAPCLAGKET